MRRFILARCSECDRPIFEDEGGIAEHLLDVLGVCRECADGIIENDFIEMEIYDGRTA